MACWPPCTTRGRCTAGKSWPAWSRDLARRCSTRSSTAPCGSPTPPSRGSPSPASIRRPRERVPTGNSPGRCWSGGGRQVARALCTAGKPAGNGRVISRVTVERDDNAPQGPGTGTFEVHLDVFEGPFDLLLGLISKHKLDITEVALSQVTDEFIAFIRARADGWDLDMASYFLVVAATLLDLKAARLLPAGEVEDEEDLALLEARDLLFARLLQYRAYKEVAGEFAGRMAAQGRRFARRVPVEPRFAGLLPEVLLGLGPAEFARIAAVVLAPRP